MDRVLKLPKDDAAALALLRSPPPPYPKSKVVGELIVACRETVVLRAFEQGLLDPRRLDEGGFGLLHVAAACESIELLRSLFDKGVSPILQDELSGCTALGVAVGTFRDWTVFFLMDMDGVELNMPSNNGTTPLMRAVSRGMLEVVKRLVAYGAEVGICAIPVGSRPWATLWTRARRTLPFSSSGRPGRTCRSCPTTACSSTLRPVGCPASSESQCGGCGGLKAWTVRQSRCRFRGQLLRRSRATTSHRSKC